MHPSSVVGTNFQNVFLYFSYTGALVYAKTYGYATFFSIIGGNIDFDSFGDYFYETLIYKKTVASKAMFMIRKVQFFGLRQIWNTEFGTETGDLQQYRGTKLSLDDAYYLIPFSPTLNSDYSPTGLTGNFVGK